MPANTTTPHLDAPIGADLYEMLERAAEIRGITLTDFVVGPEVSPQNISTDQWSAAPPAQSVSLQGESRR
jgi:hypothetical protein